MSLAELLDLVFLAAVAVLAVMRQLTVLRRTRPAVRLDLDGSARRWAQGHLPNHLTEEN